MIKWFRSLSKPFPQPPTPPETLGPENPPFPKFCKDCGKLLVWETDEDGFWEDTGEQRFKKWLRCPDYAGGRWMTDVVYLIAYEADHLDRKGKRLIGNDIGYTVYQTCQKSVVYRRGR